MSSRFGARLRGVPKQVVDAIGIEVTIGREELEAASPQESYGLDDGHEGYDDQNATAYTLNAIESPVDLSVLPGDLINVELQNFRVPAEDCVFPPTRRMTLTINEGPEIGTVLRVMHAHRSAAGASYDIYTAVPEGSEGVLSSGAES